MLGGQQSYAPNGEACLVSSLVKRTGIEEPYALCDGRAYVTLNVQ